MKKFKLILLLCLISLAGNAQTDSTFIITTGRLGPFKINAKDAELEKMTGQKFNLTQQEEEYYNLDTVKLKYKGADYELSFQKIYDDEKKAYVGWQLYAVSSSDIKYKTKSGVGIGNSKSDILRIYDKYDINIYNDWMYKEKKVAKDKFQYISLSDYDTGTGITFETEDRKIIKITVSFYEGD